MAKQKQSAYRTSTASKGGSRAEDKASFRKKTRTASGLANKQAAYRK